MEKKKYILSIALFLILFLGTYYFILKDYSLEVLKDTLQNCIPGFMCLAILFVVFWQFFEALYVKRMLHHFQYKVSWGKIIGYICTIQYFSGITPSSTGGQPVQMLEMKKDGIPYEINALVVFLNIVFSKIALLFLAVFAFIFFHKQLFSLSLLFQILVIVGFVTTIFVTCLFIFLVYSKKMINVLLNLIIKFLRKLRFIKNVDEKERKLRETIEQYQKYAKFTKMYPKILLEAFCIMLCQRIANLAISYAIYLAFGGNQMSIFEIIAFQIFILLGSDLMPSPGGIGVNEGLLLEANKRIYGGDLVLSGTLLLRSINFYAILIISGIVYMIFHFCKRKKVIWEGAPQIEATSVQTAEDAEERKIAPVIEDKR